LILNKTTREFYRLKKAEWEKLYKKEEKEKKPGGNYYRNLLKYNGNLFTKIVISAYKNNVIAPTEFSEYMGWGTTIPCKYSKKLFRRCW